MKSKPKKSKEGNKTPRNLLDFFQSSPLAGADLDLERMRGDFRATDDLSASAAKPRSSEG